MVLPKSSRPPLQIATGEKGVILGGISRALESFGQLLLDVNNFPVVMVTEHTREKV